MARKLCTVDECEDQAISRGLCPKHYQALRRRERDPLVGTRRKGRAPSDGPCAMDGCERELYSRGLCMLHYRQVRRRINNRPFVEKVLAFWAENNLPKKYLNWEVNPQYGTILFRCAFTEDGTEAEVTDEMLDMIAASLKKFKEDKSGQYVVMPTLGGRDFVDSGKVLV